MVISHRLKGFDWHDASESGLQKALAANVPAIEIDIRTTKDNQLLINHDAWISPSIAENTLICEYTLKEIRDFYKKALRPCTPLTLSGFLSHMSGRGIRIFIDIKEYGFEERILNMLKEHNMLDTSTIVSWLPESLLKFHTLCNNVPLCFSHYPVSSKMHFYWQRTGLRTSIKFHRWQENLPAVKTNFHYNAYNRTNFPIYDTLYYRGTDHEHFVKGAISGSLLAAIRTTKGSVYIHRNRLNPILIESYNKLGIGIVVYGIRSEAQLECVLLYKPEGVMVDAPGLLGRDV